MLIVVVGLLFLILVPSPSVWGEVAPLRGEVFRQSVGTSTKVYICVVRKQSPVIYFVDEGANQKPRVVSRPKLTVKLLLLTARLSRSQVKQIERREQALELTRVYRKCSNSIPQPSASPRPSITPSATATATLTATPTFTPQPTPTNTATIAATPSSTPTSRPSATPSPSATVTPSASVTPQPSPSPTPSVVSDKALFVSATTGNDAYDGRSTARPFKSIQAAVNKMVPGETVYVMNGEYGRDNTFWNLVEFNKGGRADAWLTLRNYPGHRPTLISDDWAAIDILGYSYIHIEGFRIIGNNANVTLARAQEVARMGDDYHISGAGIIGQDYEGRFPTHIIIRNNIVSDFGGAGIGCLGCDYVQIEYNEIYNCSWYSKWGTSGTGLYQPWNSDDNTGVKNTYIGNKIYNNKNLIPFFMAGEVTDGNGIIIDDSRQTQNIRAKSPRAGAYKGRTLVANNFIFNNGGRAVNVYLSDNVDIVNNTIYKNGAGVPTSRSDISAVNSDSVNVYNNIIVSDSTTKPISLYQATNIAMRGNLVESAGSPEFATSFNKIGVSPGFANPGVGNFDLITTSPAIDIGESALSLGLGIVMDYFGTARVKGPKVDAGAQEVR
jgi:hypothetical protein